MRGKASPILSLYIIDHILDEVIQLPSFQLPFLKKCVDPNRDIAQCRLVTVRLALLAVCDLSSYW